MSIEIPHPGQAVGGVRDGIDGNESMFVAVSPDGRVTYNASTAAQATVSSAAFTQALETTVAPSACDDGFYRLLGFFWADPFDWYKGTHVDPITRLDPAQVTNQIHTGVSNITEENTDCDAYSTDTIDYKNHYLGTDDRISDITGSTDTCHSTHDAVSTIDFGPLIQGDFGLTCYWLAYPGVTAVQVDIRLNQTWNWVNAATMSCSTAVDLQDIVTHEAGHAFGLDDISTTDHKWLTMSGGSGYCITRDRTLGKGDIKGLLVYDT